VSRDPFLGLHRLVLFIVKCEGLVHSLDLLGILFSFLATQGALGLRSSGVQLSILGYLSLLMDLSLTLWP